MSVKNDVVITGLGVLSPLGLNKNEVKEALLATTSGIELFDAPPLKKQFAVGRVRRDFEDQFTRLELPYLDRCQHMAILAAEQAIDDAGLSEFSAYKQRAGVYYGNVNGGIATEQVWYQQLLVDGKQASRPFSAMAIMRNSGAAQISIRRKILGPVITHGSACGSSGVAIGEAVRAIRDGYLDVAVVGGAEAPLTASLIGVFEGTRALSAPDPEDPSRTCKPFSAKRSGLVLGEGAAFLVIESAEHARKRNAHCYGKISGYGIAADASHIGTPNSEGQAAALLAALNDAGLAARDIGYINAHATATNGGDVVESNAINAVFSEQNVPVSSTKSVHGHLLGAASALEFLITTIALNESILPATAHLDDVDPKCSLNHIANKAVLNRKLEHALSFSCGFGGTNVALIVSQVPHTSLN